jgi:thiosulfate/3-mercaptopyruvate sulfurtransferase
MYPIISVQQLHSRLGDPRVVIVDCRFQLNDPDAGRRAYDSGHIPGAQYAHLEQDLSAQAVAGKTGRHPLPEPLRSSRRLEGWGIGSDSCVVAYDASSGAFAARLWWLLKWLGHDCVAVLDGGFAAWNAASLPITSTVQRPALAVFEVKLRADRTASAADVETARQSTEWRLLDARSADRFAGQHEPIDAVAGRIPGACSLPFESSLVDGHFRPLAELRQLYASALSGVRSERAIAYCGSGVTACHLILGAEAAGFSGVRLYAGSWSEWITDPTRPVASGR